MAAASLSVLLSAPLVAVAQTPEPSPTPAPSPAAQEPATESQATVRVEGVILERGSKRPLSDVNVFLLPMKLKATTDAKGRFVFENAPEGRGQLIVNHTGYLRMEKDQTVEPNGKPLRILLEKMDNMGFEITVRDRQKKRDDTTRSLGQEQFLTAPGAQGDPVKAIQNLPGVARPPGFSSQIIIQGSEPEDTAYLLDDHEVPLVFHFGGLTSVITPEAIDQVDYLSAGYGPEYGRAMGGLIGLRTRNPDTDRIKGFAFADTFKAGALLEGPLDDKSAFLATARYSYIGVVLAQALKDNPAFDLTVAPAFGDFTFIYTRKMSPKDDFKLTTLVSRDELKFLFREPLRADPSIRGNFSNETSFYRLIPQWTRKYDDGAVSRLSFGVGQDFINFDIGENFFNLETKTVTNRLEYEKKLTPAWKSYWGMDNQFTRAAVKLRLPSTNNQGGVSNPISTGETFDLNITQDDLRLAPYWRNTIRAEGSKLTLMPSLRVDYFNVTNEVKPQPRMALRYDENDWLNYRAAAGLYFQPPEPQETSPNFGNPDITSPHAWHFTVGAEKDFREGAANGFVVQTNFFYRLFEDLVINSNRPIVRNGVTTFERFNNDGRGTAVGAEFFIRYDAKPWSGWISYTLSYADREQPDVGRFRFRFDQTHNLNLIAARDLPKNWQLSGRLRYVTGNPVTPVVGGTFDSDNDVFIPTRGPLYSERLDPFFQLDLRADKKWIYEEWILWVYLDIQNVTNTQNPEAIRYSYDFTQETAVMGLPIIPLIGVRGEF